MELPRKNAENTKEEQSTELFVIFCGVYQLINSSHCLYGLSADRKFLDRTTWNVVKKRRNTRTELA